MHRSTRDIASIFIVLFAAIGLLGAARLDRGTRLGNDVAYLNRIGGRPQRAAQLEKSLAALYAVTPARIAALRTAGMGEGDLVAALSAASLLPRGVSDATIARVLAAWKSSPRGGWTGVAKSLGISAGRLAVAVERVTRPPAPGARTTAGPSRPGFVTVSGLGRNG